MTVTRQGVRNLNGPRMNGSGYNGRRGVTCPHYRDPHFPTQRCREVIAHDEGGVQVIGETSVYRCTACGEVRFTGDER